jgi:hypothetical protein
MYGRPERLEYARHGDFKRSMPRLGPIKGEDYEPLKRVSGVDPDRLIREQEILFPVDVLIIMAGPRQEGAGSGPARGEAAGA